jgi:hypothetical protein
LSVNLRHGKFVIKARATSSILFSWTLGIYFTYTFHFLSYCVYLNQNKVLGIKIIVALFVKPPCLIPKYTYTKNLKFLGGRNKHKTIALVRGTENLKN